MWQLHCITLFQGLSWNNLNEHEGKTLEHQKTKMIRNYNLYVWGLSFKVSLNFKARLWILNNNDSSI